MTWEALDPYETHNGPYYQRREPDGRMSCLWQPRPHHRNGAGPLHGGALMSFADFCLFAIAWPHIEGQSPCVTLAFDAQFVAAGRHDADVWGAGQVVRATKSVIFVQGQLSQEGAPILAFSGTLKRLRAG
jgi:uncharacterized protein (TIGR00369 family)